MKPFAITLGGQELEGWTSASLNRSKDELTGSLQIDMFFSYVPDKPVQTAAGISSEIVVYVGGIIAFRGTIDKRTGAGPGNTLGSRSIGPEEYAVSITARGKTKALVDGSHSHPTTNMMQPTTKEVVEKLIENRDVQLEWLATEVKLDKQRLRDGALINDELRRIASENAHFMYETRDGKLRVTDDVGPTVGDPLVLGENIISFSATQSEDEDRSEIRIKGQRTKKDQWGEAAVLNTFTTITNGRSTNKAPTVIQHYGDADDETLERRARFEANNRMASSREVNVKVFHVSPKGNPWDIGNLHYVEVPCEGIFDMMECTGITYEVTPDSVTTTLKLSPAPSTGIAGGGKFSGLGSLNELVTDLVLIGANRKAQMGVTSQPGQHPASWGGPALAIADAAKSIFNLQPPSLLEQAGENKPPERLIQQ